MKINSLIAVLAVFACTFVAQPACGYSAVSDPVKVRVAGKNASLQVVLIKGGKVVDEAPSAICGKRIEGTFAVKVEFEKEKPVYTPLNGLMRIEKEDTENLAFCARRWKIVTGDYNNDGQVDFNLGQYGTSNGWLYWFFTVSPSGQVSLLAVPGGYIFLADDKNSTDRIRTSDKGIRTTAYVNACEKEENCGWFETTYQWNAARKRFEKHGSKRLKDYSRRSDDEGNS